MLQTNVSTTINAGEGSKMESPFSTSAGFFGITWRENQKTHSVWVGNIYKAILLFLSLKVRRKKLFYFSPEGKEMIIFRRNKT